jgi:hypothetical protein
MYLEVYSCVKLLGLVASFSMLIMFVYLYNTQSFEALRAQKYVTSFQESGINGRCLLGITSEADAEEFGIVFR